MIIPKITENIKHGDMPGDVINIKEEHIKKATTILPLLLEEIEKVNSKKTVVSVFGGSGVGKSEIASVLAAYLDSNDLKTYILSGDNYPFRIPVYNDAERLTVFRTNGLKQMIKDGVYNSNTQKQLDELWADEKDSDPKQGQDYPFLSSYQKGGRQALKEYLGTRKEQDYDEINTIIAQFKNGDEHIFLKRMGRKEEERYYEDVNFADIDVLIIEWTHGGNENIIGIDVPILLNSSPEETMAHRLARARDNKVDSAFTTMVLQIEQEELDQRKASAKIVISKKGEII